MGDEHDGRAHRQRSSWVGFVVALVLGAATYAAWLAWDTEYYYDAAVGAYQGPYRPLQVLGCGLTFAIVTALLAMRWSAPAVAAGATLGFWLPWTVLAASRDETGLFVVGSVLLLVGLAVGSAVAGAVGLALRRIRTGRASSRSSPS